MQKKSFSLVKELAMGFCLGTANIIPGVSGGTFLLVFNIYERVFLSLNNIHKDNIFYFSGSIVQICFGPDRAASVKTFCAWLGHNDFVFLLKLIIGAVAAIVSLSSVMKYLMVYHFSTTYALFFGLILISIVVPIKLLTDKKIYLLGVAVFGTLATIYVASAVNPYEKAKIKSDAYEGQYEAAQTDHPEKQVSKFFSFTHKYTLEEYAYASLCGAVAISAMVLPGISGSLVLILMGEYFEVVSAISGLKTASPDAMLFLACFILGLVFGGLLFARLLTAVLNRYYNATMAFLVGLMAGSLYALWPFKKSVIMAQQYVKKDGVISIVENVRVYTNINQWPQMGAEFYLSMVAFFFGCLIMFFFIGKEVKQ